MRVTNSMLISSVLNDMNRNTKKLSDLTAQMSNNRKFAHISDDPVSVIYSQQARYKLAQLSHYQKNVETSQQWLTQAEASLMDINGIIQSAYEACIDASTDVKGGTDKANVGKYIGQLRDQMLQTLNGAFGEKFIFGGYNTTGTQENNKTTAPFTLEPGMYKSLSNGIELYDADGNALYTITTLTDGSGKITMTDSEGKLKYELTPDDPANPEYYEVFKADDEGKMVATDTFLPAKYEISGSTEDLIDVLNSNPPLFTKMDVWMEGEVLCFNGVEINNANMTAVNSELVKMREDVLTLDLGPGIDMEISFNGLDIVLFDPNDYDNNIFNVINGLYQAAVSGSPAEDLNVYINDLQESQNHILAMVAELGGKQNRLEMLESRYAVDYLNYTQMKSDAEDADQAEVILNYKMAEAVYQAALAAGAKVIQPTLMDFLR